jgi:type IV secretion system protein VirB10
MLSPGAEDGKTGVRRVNHIPIVIVCGLLASVGLMIMIALVGKTKKIENAQLANPEVSRNKAEEQAALGSLSFPDLLLSAGVAPESNPKPQTPSDVSSSDRPTLKTRETSTELHTVGSSERKQRVFSPTGTQYQSQNSSQSQIEQQRATERERIRQMRIQQLTEAARGGTSLRLDGLQSSSGSGNAMFATPASLQNPQTPAQQQLAQIHKQLVAQAQGQPGFGGAGAPTGPQQTAGGAPQQLGRWDSAARVEKTRPNMIRTGAVIPATLITGINSELAGQITGQVAQHVYDTATGSKLLIPQGSRLVGANNSDVSVGQSRVMIAWQRVIFPNGDALDLGEMEGTDQSGYTGFSDKVNNHYFRIFGSALLMSAIVAGANTGIKAPEEGEELSYQQSLQNSFGGQIASTTTAMLEKNMAIAPTIEIRPGFRFLVSVTKDLQLPGEYGTY